jgi:hypothetical protein
MLQPAQLLSKKKVKISVVIAMTIQCLFSSTPFLGDVNNMVHASVVYLGFCAPPHPPHKKKIKLKGDYDSMVMLHISCCQVIKNLNKIREI